MSKHGRSLQFTFLVVRLILWNIQNSLMRVTTNDVTEDMDMGSSGRLLQKLYDLRIGYLLELGIVAVDLFWDWSILAQLKAVGVDVVFIFMAPHIRDLLNVRLILNTPVADGLRKQDAFRLAIVQAWHVVEGGLDSAGRQLGGVRHDGREIQTDGRTVQVSLEDVQKSLEKVGSYIQSDRRP